MFISFVLQICFELGHCLRRVAFELLDSKMKGVVVDDQFGESIDCDDVPVISCNVDWYKDEVYCA